MEFFKPKYSILVLSNCGRKTSTTLSIAIELAKLINGAIDVFGVESFKRLNSESSQMAVLRDLTVLKESLKERLKKPIEKLILKEDVPIIYNASIGNLAETVRKYILLTKPDLVVLGNSKKLRNRWFRSTLLQTVLHHHKGVTLVTGPKGLIIKNNRLSFGFIDQFEENHPVMKTLLKKTKGTHRIFQFNSNKKPNLDEQIQDHVLYDFVNNQGVNTNYSKYIKNDKIHLLCIKKEGIFHKNFIEQQKQNIINTLSNSEIPVMVFPN